MRAIKPAVFVLLAALLGVGGWAACRAGGLRLRQLPWLLGSSAQNTELPVAEYREVRSGIAGKTGRLLTIDRSGRATLQTLPLGSGSKTMRTHLSCAELVDFPEAMKMEFREFRSDYGQNHAINAEGQEEISIVDRWDGRERRVVWHNPPSDPKPPEGRWAHVMVYFEDIMRRAEEASKPPESASDVVLEYGHLSSGVVGSYITLLSIHKSGQVSLGHGLGVPWPVGVTQITPAELATLLRTIEKAKFEDSHQCYGQHAPVNPQNTWMIYWREGTGKEVTWMSDPADPKPPDGWFRIVAMLDQFRARIKPRQGRLTRPG